MPTLLERIGVEMPVVQAGMGDVAGHELAVAVSAAGGLGTIAMPGNARRLAAELARARALTDRPLAVNLLLPFLRRDAAQAAADADVVVTFWGQARRRTPKCWLHQVGSVEEARAAHGAGADGVVVQGVEAGGHVRGTTPALELLEHVRGALGRDYPVWVAGGIATAADVSAALAAGAEAAVAGTRFLLTDESRAHAQYKQRLLAAHATILTELFGAGWPAAPHRVVPNAATERWLRGGRAAPRALSLLHRATALMSRAPIALQERMLRMPRGPANPFLGPAPPLTTTPDGLVDVSPLYAGETVKRIDDIRPAADVVRALAG